MNDSDFELLSAAFDREATPEELARVEQLLESSAEARQQWDELARMSQSLADLPRETLPAEFPSQVLQLAERRSLLPQAALAVAQSVSEAVSPSGLQAAQHIATTGQRSVRRLWISVAAMTATAAALFVVVSGWFGPGWLGQNQPQLAGDRQRDPEVVGDLPKARAFAPAGKPADFAPPEQSATLMDATADQPVPLPKSAGAAPGQGVRLQMANADRKRDEMLRGGPGDAADDGDVEVYVIDVADGMTLRVLGKTLSPQALARSSRAQSDKAEPSSDGLYIVASGADINDALARVREQTGRELESHMVAMADLPPELRKLLNDQGELESGKYDRQQKEESVKPQADAKPTPAAPREEKPGEPVPGAGAARKQEKDVAKGPADKPEALRRRTLELAVPDQYVEDLQKRKAAEQTPSLHEQPEAAKKPLAESAKETAKKGSGKPPEKSADKSPDSPRRVLLVVRKTARASDQSPAKAKGGA